MIKKLEKAIWLLLFLPYIAQAQNIIIDNTPNPGGLPSKLRGDITSGTVSGAITAIISILLSLAGLIAVAMIIWGGFKYITARGDDKVVVEAKKTITNSVIGLVIIILSYVIVRIVANAGFGRI